MRDPRDGPHSAFDKDGGGPFVTDSNGKFILDQGHRIKAPVAVKDPTSGWTTYEGDCCPLCGRMSCRGGCFK